MISRRLNWYLRRLGILPLGKFSRFVIVEIHWLFILAIDSLKPSRWYLMTYTGSTLVSEVCRTLVLPSPVSFRWVYSFLRLYYLELTARLHSMLLITFTFAITWNPVKLAMVAHYHQSHGSNSDLWLVSSFQYPFSCSDGVLANRCIGEHWL